MCGNCGWRLRVAIVRKRTAFPTTSCGPWSAGAARAVACRPWRRATPRNRTRSLRWQYLQTGRAHTTRSDLTYIPFAYCPSMRRGRCQPRSCGAAERVGPCTDSSERVGRSQQPAHVSPGMIHSPCFGSHFCSAGYTYTLHVHSSNLASANPAAAYPPAGPRRRRSASHRRRACAASCPARDPRRAASRAAPAAIP